MFTNKFTSILLSSLLAVSCGGGGGDSTPGLQGSDVPVTPPGGGTEGGGTDSGTSGQNPGTDVPAASTEALLTQRTWYQVNFQPPALGSRFDALYKFQIATNGIHIGQRQSINIRGNDVSTPGLLAVNFTWSIDANNRLTLVLGNIGGISTHTEVIQLTYQPATDQLMTESSDFGPGVWEGCNSPNRPPFTLARCN